MRQFSAGERFAASQMAQADLYFFARWMFLQRRGFRWQRAQHHAMICHALERVFRGECRRLIINVPPRYSKTELAVVNFVAWAMGQVPDAEFIHASYSGTLAVENSAAVRAVMQHEAYREVFPAAQLASDAKGHWKTTAGGVMYAAGAGGTITGFGAGKHRDGFGGCFPAGTRVWTDRGLLPIDRIVRERMRVRAWAFDYAGHMVLRPVIGWHANPPNDIVRVTFSDGAAVECTPDHQFWTNGRGWVRADSLRIDDRLPCVHGGVQGADDVSIDTKGSGGRLNAKAVLSPGAARSIADGDVRLRASEHGPQVGCPPAFPDHVAPAGHGFPSVPAPDLLDDGSGHAVARRDYLCGLSGSVVDRERLLVGQYGDGVRAGLAERAVPLAVNDVGRAGVVSQVVESVVQSVPVGVADVRSIGARTDESRHDEPVNRGVLHVAADGQADPAVAMPVVGELEDALGNLVGRSSPADDTTLASHAALAADRVGAFISGDRTPLLVQRVRHDEATFCLTVDEYHNFTVESGLVVKNCIIIDDPHKPDEARSDVIRQGVIDWFQNTLESRKNSPHTPVILIMQRLHEKDLAGWLLGGGNGEQWEHVCLPALRDDGTALWPEKHDVEALRRMRVAAPYTFAGQYQQSPAPPEGNIFRPDAIEVVDAVPVGTRFVRGWDLAASHEDGDWTAGGKLGVTPSGRWIIADMVRLQGRPDAVQAALKNTAGRDGTATRVRLPQDPGQAGKAQVAALTKLLAGYSVTAKPVSGDKVLRAEPFAAQVNVGNVMMLRAEWNDALISELRMFPNGAHDDQVDALSDAFSELNVNTFGLLELMAAQAAQRERAMIERKQEEAHGA